MLKIFAFLLVVFSTSILFASPRDEKLATMSKYWASVKAHDDGLWEKQIDNQNRYVVDKKTTEELTIVGDIHGDLNAFLAPLIYAGVIRVDKKNPLQKIIIEGRQITVPHLIVLKRATKDEKIRVLFLGDMIDRGPFSIEIVALVKKLAEEKAAIVFLAGNHEIMVALGNKKYFTDAAYGEHSLNFSQFKKCIRSLLQTEILRSVFVHGSTIFTHAPFSLGLLKKFPEQNKFFLQENLRRNSAKYRQQVEKLAQEYRKLIVSTFPGEGEEWERLRETGLFTDREFNAFWNRPDAFNATQEDDLVLNLQMGFGHLGLKKRIFSKMDFDGVGHHLCFDIRNSIVYNKSAMPHSHPSFAQMARDGRVTLFTSIVY